MALNFGKAEFARSVGAQDGFLRDGLPQFAFAGRSNVGKSSVINRLLGRKNLAYVGASPGKTTQINYFLGDAVIAEMTCVGSLLIVALSLNMLGLTKIKVMNLVPAILLPIVLCLFI